MSHPRLEEAIMRGDKTLPTRELADAPIASAFSSHIRPFSRASEMRPWSTLPLAQKQALKDAAAKELGLDPKVKANVSKIGKRAEETYTAARSADLQRLKDGDAFLSVSEDRRVALSVAADPAMAGRLLPGESIYLFTVRLSPLDVVDPADYVGAHEAPSHVKFGSGTPEAYSARIEGIVMPHIHASEIRSVEKLDPAASASFKMELQWH